MNEPLVLLGEGDVKQVVAPQEAGFGALASERGPLPLKAMDVAARIDGLVSQVTLRQTFVNSFDVALEATYIFPLPDGAAVDTDSVPDASRISPPVLLPGFPNPVRLALTVDVHPCGLPVSDFRCSLHGVRTREDLGVQRIELRPGERLDRDFILRFRL